jgi:hypothetical protein
MEKAKHNRLHWLGLLHREFAFHSPFSVEECVASLQAQSGREFSHTWNRYGWDSLYLRVIVEPADEYSARFVFSGGKSEVRGTLGQAGNLTHVVGLSYYDWRTRGPALMFEIILAFVVCLLMDKVLTVFIALMLFLVGAELVMNRYYQTRLANIVINTLSR